MEGQFHIIELYAGRARINRLARAAGYNAVAADHIYDDTEKSSLQLNSNAGFTRLGCVCNSSILQILYMQ